MRSPKSPHTTVVPRVDPPVATCGRPLGDFDFSANFGVSQSRAGDVVEKHRAKEKVASDPDRPVSQMSVWRRDHHWLGERLVVHVGRVQADRGPASIFI
jgi:hypothetical protein